MNNKDNLRYEVQLYELENGRFNWYAKVATRMAQGWSRPILIGDGSADSEAEAIKAAQAKATEDRQKREEEGAAMKVVALK
jgi:hypothetical protein